MAVRPAHWAGTTIRSHRVSPAGHRATSRRSPLRFAPYAAAGAGGLFLFFSVLVGFHAPSTWHQPRPPGDTSVVPVGELPPEATQTAATDEAEGVEPGDPPRANRGSRSSRDPSAPPVAVPEPPRPPVPAVPTVAASTPQVTLMPTPGCPPPLPTDTPKGRKASHPPRGPKVLGLPAPSVGT